MNNLIINGMSDASGGVFDEVRIDGISSIKGDLTCDLMGVDGICTIMGSVRVNGRTDIDGICKISGDLDAEEMEVDGRLLVSGSSTAEKAALKGEFVTEGTVNIGELDLKFHGSSRAKEVVGSKIRISHGSGAICSGTRYFRADLIEGDDISLERSKINTVRGDRVVIGKGCEIGKVEYKGELTVHPKSVVKEKVEL